MMPAGHHVIQPRDVAADRIVHTRQTAGRILAERGGAPGVGG
jgi:hypothetical protein